MAIHASPANPIIGFLQARIEASRQSQRNGAAIVAQAQDGFLVYGADDLDELFAWHGDAAVFTLAEEH